MMMIMVVMMIMSMVVLWSGLSGSGNDVDVSGSVIEDNRDKFHYSDAEGAATECHIYSYEMLTMSIYGDSDVEVQYG